MFSQLDNALGKSYFLQLVYFLWKMNLVTLKTKGNAVSIIFCSRNVWNVKHFNLFPNNVFNFTIPWITVVLADTKERWCLQELEK